MAYKPRTKSKKLIIFEYLNNRMTLLEKDRRYLYNLKKGYEGEVMFDELTEKLRCECYILNDLRLVVNNTPFQIDTLIIVSRKIFLNEVKNFEGDFFYENKFFYKVPKTEYTNPVLQLTRSESLLRQLLQYLGFNVSIEGKVVFINPAFTLYQAPLDQPIIFPTQIKSYIDKLDATSSKLDGNLKKLADKLISLHTEEDPYQQLPTYKFEKLKKGLTCENCNSFSISVKENKCVCDNCMHEERVESAVLRIVQEIKLLNPKWKITTSGVYEWCVVISCKKKISRILKKHFKMAGKRRWIYYE